LEPRTGGHAALESVEMALSAQTTAISDLLHSLGRFLPLSAALRQHVVMLRLHLIEFRQILLSQSNGLEVQNAPVVKDSLKVGTLRSL
jgi:hypothetical protein